MCHGGVTFFPPPCFGHSDCSTEHAQGCQDREAVHPVGSGRSSVDVGIGTTSVSGSSFRRDTGRHPDCTTYGESNACCRSPGGYDSYDLTLPVACFSE